MRAVAKTPSSQPALLAAVVLMLVVAVGIAFMPGDDQPVPGADDEPATTPPASAAAAVDGDVRRGDAPAPTDASTGGAAASERAAALGDDPGASRPLPEDARWIELLVVDKATGAPQPGALVHWHDDTAHAFLRGELDDDDEYMMPEAMQVSFQFVERAASAAGWRTRADADGKARVTLGKEWTKVAAVQGALFGELQLRDNSVPPAAGYRIELAPELGVTVRVVDDRDEPCAGVPLGLALLDAANADAAMSISAFPLAISDAQGLATIPHLQGMCAAGGSAGGADDRRIYDLERRGSRRKAAIAAPPKPVWHVRALVLGSRENGVAFDPTAPPSAPLALRLPPCGTLRVRAESGGKPAVGFRGVYARRLTGANEQASALDGGYRHAYADADGWARFPWVALGLRFELYSATSGGVHGQHDGPTARNQEVDVVLQPAADAALLAGRLLYPDRSPARGLRIVLRANGENLWLHEQSKTDADGRFVVNLGSLGDDRAAKSMWIETVVKDAPAQRAELAGRTLPTGREDLGDIVLDDPPLLVAGRFTVAGTGAPFAEDVSLEVERQLPPEPGEHEAQWEWLDGQSAHKGKDGRFVVRGAAAAGNYRLQVGSDKALPTAPIAFRVGAADLVVELQLGNRLAASALLPPKTPELQVRFKLLPSRPQALTRPDDDDDDDARRVQLEADIELNAKGRADARWNALPADTYTLRVELWTTGSELLTIPDVVVPPPATPDPRLVDIDLRARLRLVEVAVVGADGKALPRSNGAVFAQGTNVEPWRGVAIREDVADLVLPPGPYDLLVCARGYRPLPVRGDGPRIEARVEAWPTVVVRLAGKPALPPTANLRLWLAGPRLPEARYETTWGQSGDREDYLQASGRRHANANGVVKLPIGDGPHTLHVGLYNDHGGREIALTPPVIVLPSQTEITVAVPDEAWQRAIAELPNEPGKDGAPNTPR
jgi:hypothetical protein